MNATSTSAHRPIKVIVTNGAALAAKYGPCYQVVRDAIGWLIKADADRGLDTRLVELDDRAAMAAFGATPVTDPGSPEQNKDAVDAVAASLAPEYLMILGAPDVVPHQDLRNPLYHGPGGSDLDPCALSDVPYACEAPYGQDPAAFLGPTRVLGRLPDLNRGQDGSPVNPDYLTGLLKTASGWTARPPSAEMAYFGLTAEDWQDSTSLSVRHLFCSTNMLRLSPGAAPPGTQELGRRFYFINCHGATMNPKFYGQLQDHFPVALDAPELKGTVREGAVAAVECCYGAELYPPSVRSGAMGVANTFLGSAGYGYFGSTTESYGPATGNSHADVICEGFLRSVLGGASLGRAALQAHQDYVRTLALADPIDLKTAMQFGLLGDPSIHPLRVPVAHAEVIPAGAAEDAATLRGSSPAKRRERRLALAAQGLQVGQAVAHAHSRPRSETTGQIRPALERIAAGAGVDLALISSYEVRRPSLVASAGRGPDGEALHVLFGPRREGAEVPQAELLVAKEEEGRIAYFTHLHRR